MKYRVVKVIPASIMFQHNEIIEVVSEHTHKIAAFLSYLLHNSIWIPCYIEKIY